jgi:hypothetical protein
MALGRQTAATAGFLLVFGGVISGQVMPPVAPAAVPNTATSGVVNVNARSAQGMIHGTAVDRDAAPLPNATVRLRNLASQQIEKTSTANQLGEFTFIVKPEIPYVVEIADQTGQILAIGNVVTAQAGEVASAVVTVPVRLPAAVAGLMGNTAGSVLSAASGAGITALKSAEFEPPPASPEH